MAVFRRESDAGRNRQLAFARRDVCDCQSDPAWARRPAGGGPRGGKGARQGQMHAVVASTFASTSTPPAARAQAQTRLTGSGSGSGTGTGTARPGTDAVTQTPCGREGSASHTDRPQISHVTRGTPGTESRACAARGQYPAEGRAHGHSAVRCGPAPGPWPGSAVGRAGGSAHPDAHARVPRGSAGPLGPGGHRIRTGPSPPSFPPPPLLSRP